MEIKRIPNVQPENSNTPVTLKVCGNQSEIRYTVKKPIPCPVRKVDRDHGVDTRTGECIQYKHTKNRAEAKANVAQSLRRLCDIINANLAEPERALWVTLTYAGTPMTEPKRLYEDFRRFWQRLQYYLKKRSFSKVEYILCAEPQARGSWHGHLLILFPHKAPFVPNDDMARLWGQGFTKTKALNNVDNIGLYLSCYLGDMELTEAICAGTIGEGGTVKEIEAKDGAKKAYIKGARLSLYPPGFNIYRCSRGIKRPAIYQTTEKRAQEIIGAAPLVYEKTIRITDGLETKNIINYRQFNRAKGEYDR